MSDYSHNLSITSDSTNFENTNTYSKDIFTQSNYDTDQSQYLDKPSDEQLQPLPVTESLRSLLRPASAELIGSALFIFIACGSGVYIVIQCTTLVYDEYI